MKISKLLIVAICSILISAGSQADNNPVFVGLDAEFGHKTSTSAQAIEQGMTIAIDEINARGGVLGGRPLALVKRDNRSLPARARQNIRELADIKDLVAIFTGKFSPVVLDILPLIHERQIPLLDPWAAADGIIDNGYSPNFAFRLSLRDSWAIPRMVEHVRKRGMRRIGMMVPKNGWGRSRVRAMEHVISQSKKNSVSLSGIRWHFWGVSTLVEQYQELTEAGAEAIIFVANEPEAAILLREIAALPKNSRVPVISHWGVSGGDLTGLAGDVLFEADFSVIQTFTFANNESTMAHRVATKARKKFNLSSAADIKSQVGFAHGYDLLHILAMAIEKAQTTDRLAIRNALEQTGPYEGLVRKYERPFAPDRHEALSPEILFIGRYSKAGDIHRIE